MPTGNLGDTDSGWILLLRVMFKQKSDNREEKSHNQEKHWAFLWDKMAPRGFAGLFVCGFVCRELIFGCVNKQGKMN